MTEAAHSRSDRAGSRRRLRHGFSRQAHRELDELVALLRSGQPEEREHVCHALARMAERAQSLGLSGVTDGARAAAEQIRLGSSGAVLGAVVRALGEGDRPRLFAPIAVITGGRTDLLGRLDQTGCERARIVPSVDALRDEVWFEDMQAALCPVKPRRELQRLAQEAPGRAYAWGPAADVQKRMTALSDGAVGYFGLPLDFAGVLERIRFDTWRRMSPAPRVQLVAGADVLGDAVQAALTQAGIAVVRGASAPEVLTGVLATCPELVLATGSLDAGDLAAVVGTLRADEDAGAVPIVLIGDERDHGMESGIVDGVLPPDLPPTRIAAAIRRRLDRPSGRVPHRDPLTGLDIRPAVLARLDAEYCRVRREGRPLAIVLLELDGVPTEAADADRALRRVAEVLRARCRRYDHLGRLGGGAFLIALPGCTAAVAARRMVEMQEAVRRRVARDLLLAELTFTAGVADAVLGLDTLLARADLALGEARLRGRGAVEWSR